MKNIIKKNINNALESLNLPIVEYNLQIPKNKENGDLSTNIAFILSKHTKKNPMQTASTIVEELNKSNVFKEINIANPGFINFTINPDIIIENLNIILDKDESYGKNNSGKGKKVLLEFVSANPTGPLTVGHGRGAILGDSLKRILTWNGFEVDTEYYYNNAGRQMKKLAESVEARYLELNNLPYTFPEDGYQGKYIIDIAQDINNQKITDLNTEDFKKYAEKYIFKQINNTLNKLKIEFNSFFNESDLYKNKLIDDVVSRLRKQNLVYEKDGATWFEGSKVGRENDRVLIKNTGEPTYRLPDMAYHVTKFERGYDLIIDIFGADHMDAYPDVLEVLNQLNYDTKKVKVLIHQFVSILQNGEVVKMSTRKANFITLNKLIKEVGVDAVRYFFIMRSMNSHLNFDLDIAKEKSEKNPVYYIQYAHARICTILNKSNIETKNVNFKMLNTKEDILIINNLINFEEVILKLKDTLEPQILSNYLYDLATKFHKYYAHNRIINDNVELTKARLLLIKSVKIIIKNGLNILGISAPESM